MSSSKSLPFMIIAGVILAAAVVWNIFNEDTIEKPTGGNEVVTEKVVNKATPRNSQSTQSSKPVAVQKSEPVPVIADAYAEIENLPVEEAKIEAEKLAQSNMKLAMRYNTPDKALKALQNFRDMNQSDQASGLIKYMQVAFPQTQIPAELLD